MAEAKGDTSKWSDLTARILSAIVIVAIAFAALYAGPLVWWVFVLVVYVLMLRELAGLCNATLPKLRRWGIGVLPIVVLAASVLLPVAEGEGASVAGELWQTYRLGVLRAFLVALVPVGIGIFLVGAGHRIWLVYGVLLASAALTLGFAHALVGPVGILALVGIVVISDVAGYFAGRMLGGPKFWPRISPKKTWSGTVAGWIGAAVFGALIGPDLLSLSWPAAALIAVGLAFAGQLGDIAESWIKRRAGVKDSSNLIPGHGGVLDRLDALVAAAALAGALSLVIGAAG